MEFKEVLEAAVSKQRFNINDCVEFEQYLAPQALTALAIINIRLTDSQALAFKRSIVRNSFLIEPVNDAVKSTKMATHWSERLAGDIRFASYETCEQILEKLIFRFSTLNDDDFAIVKEFCSYTVISYEMPIDYIERNADPIHTADNIDIFLNDDIMRCALLRKFIRDKKDIPASQVFQTILSNKLDTKAYLTDRALTGGYKTNREKRWEAHPNSVQYALRRDCMQIETKLLTQIAAFEGRYAEFVSALQADGLLPESFGCYKCPITGDNIQYSEFSNDVLYPTHGNSKFQVGHLNPLKSQDITGYYGHTANNIGWMSENGNRIKGSLSMDEVNELLRRIYRNRPELQ